ncbi:autoinducer binding domain-containing protein [Litorimonas sp. RW-G-Af-16]|uniref:autoinducer binding domain-containing protein n=1 Tax=Litorimonas sp. RW-G-Af-16 TaxID=3241168 RepID=UPI00390C45BB
MTSGFGNMRAYIDKIDASSSAEVAFDIMCEALETLGFTYVFAGRGAINLSEDILPSQFYFAKRAEAFILRYLQKRYIYVDPVIAHLARTNRPYRWRDSYTDLTQEQIIQTEDARAHGLCFGILLPISTRRGRQAIVSIGRETDFDLSAADMFEIELLCCVTFDVIDRHLGEATVDVPKISVKEHEILDLVAKGKTNWEIGQIMSISEYSVRDYLKSLSDRFETSNRTHTVVRAIQLGLLRA